MANDSDAGSLFFADPDESDSENVAMLIDGAVAQVADVVVPEPLFLQGSDEENATQPVQQSEKAKGKRPIPHEIYELSGESDIEVSSPADDIPRASSVSSFSDHVSMRSDSPSSSLKPTRSRRQSPKPSQPPAKRQRMASPVPIEAPNPSVLPEPCFIGEFLIPNAWSNVSGRGYIKPNDIVQILRNKPSDNPKSTKQTRSAETKTGKKKQISIATMFKPQTAKPFNRKKADTNVRLYNSKGFGTLFRT